MLSSRQFHCLIYSCKEEKVFLRFAFLICPIESQFLWRSPCMSLPSTTGRAIFSMPHVLGSTLKKLFPDTMMLTANGYLKLAHFNRSKDLSMTPKTYTIVGAAPYMAPEILTREGYDYGVDVWALGILCFELLYGESPFDESTDRAVFHRLLSFSKNPSPIRFPMGVFSKQAQNFISSILTVYGKRVGCKSDGLAELFDSDYFSDFPFEKLTRSSLNFEGLL